MFVAISFGPYETVPNKYWNYVTYHSSQRLAERWGLEQMPIAGTFGYVVIESNSRSWRVVNEVGTGNVSVTAKGSFFTVQPSPKLTLV